ncbi:MAG: class I SAM-dependent methyltransferase, partial [Candidatus Omnitrophica bacterium]|nr:class I SAM-dependent methyltransferase [Candidatus Omnitrophota bacterium]
KIDGRRSQELLFWLRTRLTAIKEMTGGDSLLDIGTGSGFVIKAAQGIFSKLYGLDISTNILKAIPQFGASPVSGDAVHIPFKDRSIDVVTLFAALHHFYDHRPILDEVYRVLRPGGIVYTDHDMNKHFFRRFRFFISLYRSLSQKERLIKNMALDETYHLSEFHSQGVDFAAVKNDLVALGFDVVEVRHHWYGLTPLTGRLFGDRPRAQGFAPLTAIIAKRQEDKR